MTDQLRRNANLVEHLGGALRDGGHALGAVPGLLKQLLQDGGWREFITQRGEHVAHDRFEEFVTTPPLKGLGATDDLVDRIVGNDPDLLILLKQARTRAPGRRRKSVKFTPNAKGAHENAPTVDRLAREAPDEFEAVRSGKKTIHKAALAAGIRRPQVSVRTDNAVSAARTLRRYMPPDQLRELARLLAEG